jgi:hypothetical protein
MGFGVLALYLPMYLYRKKVEDPRTEANATAALAPIDAPGIATEVGS